MIASIEGKSGRPRPRPPYPAKSGLWGKPTTINNVKTLASVPVIIAKGSEWFEQRGTAKCKGTAVFALTGYIANCGLVEVAMGTTLRHIIYDIGGGIPDGKAFKAVQTGGPSGGCLPAKFLDSPVDYETLAKAGSIMGSGGMVVMNEDTCMVDIARYFLDFTQRESCGECVPCRLGTKQMLDILEDICRGRGRPEDLELLQEYGEAIKLGSLCGLGQTAPNPVLSTLRYFREEYEAHVYKKRCPAVVCKEIISSPCQHTCPIDTEAQVYISLIAQKRYREAFEVILQDNPLPSVCGRVCHHPCERKCQAGKWGKSIAIRALKRFATDYAIRNGLYPPKRNGELTGSKVAIVGSGPAGLTAGHQLALKGYDVTIFEALAVIGGALMVCIPEFRLPKKVLQVDIDNIRNAGVKIKTHTKIGVDISLDQLRRDYQSVFIATGAHKSRKLRIPGEDAAGVIDAMDFLKDAKVYDKVENVGKVVGIIGGGNAAVDAARVALRAAGCEKVSMIYRRTRAEMPAFKEEIEAVIEEGVEFQFLTAPVKVLSRKGQVSGLECLQMELGEPDESGRRRPAPIEGSEFQIELDTVIVAIGEEPEVDFLKDTPELKVSDWGAIRVNPETMATNIEGVFAGGDVVTGANTVVEAMSAGKLAAVMIDKYLRGEPVTREYEFTRPSRYLPPVELTEEEIENADRPKIPALPVARRKGNFTEVAMNLSEAAAVREARRCLRCDLETEAGKKCLETLRRESEVSVS